MTPDPLSEKYYSISPYAFCNNNPVSFVDPDGESWGKAVKVVKKVYKTAKAAERSVSHTLIETTVDVLPENQISRELLDKPNKRGNTFVFKEDGTSVEIHHAGQSADGPYIEMHRSDHRGKGNYKEKHPNASASTQIDRKEFNKQRRYYWQKEYDKYYK